MDVYSGIRFSIERVSHELISAGSIFSVYSLASAFFIAFLALAFRQARRRGRVNLKGVVRAIFREKFFWHKSFHADIKLFLLSTVAAPPIVAALVVSTNTVSMAVNAALKSAFGQMEPVSSSPWLTLLSTIVIFLSYEIGYWVDHYLKHRVRFLWEFHKLHHTAEVLTPLTNFRNHPIDSVVFGYVLALFIGSAMGLLDWLFGRRADVFSVDGRNIIFIFFLWTIGHLQHSQFWIPFRGIWGRIILSPAHHQIHHSNDPSHFNRNLGSFLAVWDWMFGTLEVPSTKNPRLSYGVNEDGADPHSAAAILLTPLGKGSLAFWRALTSLKEWAIRRERSLV